jgi:uncharacterized membrane protein
MNLNKTLIGIGVVMIVLIPIWVFFIVPELTKMPGDYEREFDLFYTGGL